MDPQPADIARALRAVYYCGDYEREIDSFAQRWHGLDTEAFSRALENGTPEEKAVTLFLLNYRNVPNIRQLLSTNLESLEQ